MNEAEARAEHIDPLLNAAGWGEVEGSRMCLDCKLRHCRLRWRD